ncbi:3-phosphoshikimate 1-carboxyvinyltransferase [Tissierella pigra]|uniref:3-phosphoshikimate 1-carboxyvinyltransferase n=1 Tax=Tissierella pigra TaxID=2607614 RepID=A0A6N7XU64_9FIRM|nr:3-phosphoshikimate 1-carboxyvinyltransferase [Tissierella pigra]MBU5426809.1 3-phosphoshikimate 1-carboxyvinyltransferase [Tissierella pigra]MSU01317.1 3-phosphoshikimate 1-carboxyvinyltransferase [Tissierella pigra]
MEIIGKKSLKGEIKVPGDKSISHRAVIFGSISEGETVVENILLSEDVLNTIECFREMGVDIEINKEENKLRIIGNGLYGLKKPKKSLDCGNSGTSMRLLAGVLAGQNFESTLIGDSSLSKRPMDRIINPLRKMNVNIHGVDNKYPPISICPSKELYGIEYTLPMASAQVKSAILLASLYAKGETKVIEKKTTRDHTERMMEYFDEDDFKGKNIYVPGDISSAAFFIIGASIMKDSSIVLKDVGINPTRTGIIDVLQSMGGNIGVKNIRNINKEPIGDIYVSYSPLMGIELDSAIIGRLIDEIPIIAVGAMFAQGSTIIRNAEELKYKETDRIHAIVTELRKVGGDIEALEDGLIIKGTSTFYPGVLDSYNDHRIAMALSIAALNIDGKSKINDDRCINISYPQFYESLQKIIME